MHLNELLHAITDRVHHVSEEEAAALHAAVDAAVPPPDPASAPDADAKGK